MKRQTTLSLAVILTAMLLPSFVQAQCSAATIQGAYSYQFHGVLLNTNAPQSPVDQPNAQAGRIQFTATSGSGGTLTGSQRGNLGGAPSSRTFTGVYTVNADCTGTFSRNLDNGDTQLLSLAIADGGAEIEFAFISTTFSPQVASGVARKQ
jgi:hypothetical protein